MLHTMSSLFVAHSSRDKAFARRLTRDLQAFGVKVWIDEAELLIGDSLIQKIQAAITEMKYLGAIISVHSVQSPWVQKELEVALSLELQDREVKVLPIVIDDCTIPPFLIGKVYADFRDPHNYDPEFRRLLLRLAPSSHDTVHDSALPAEQRILSLRLAQAIVAGTSLHGQNLTDAAVVLFSLLDGSAKYLASAGCIRCGAFFGAFADIYRPAMALLLAIAEYSMNSDVVVAGAVFGLAQMRSSEGRRAFTHTLASPDISVYDKYRSLEDILRHSRLTTRDLPANFWEMIHAAHADGFRLDQSAYSELKKIEPSESLEAPILLPEWIKIIEDSKDLNSAYYRGTSTAQEDFALKSERVRLARSRLRKEDA